ncbi:MAG: hypothetical protein JJ921_12405 [Pseudomonadales bacterium]|nr:hypothetical protein [Pseudomonadales bacterium]MBO6563200.1 hypothetical protein [Pseudomonadales bacterium]MBO6597376.1 hypothetical protein [Pseudomonadales bacterium]MBO6703130.1 hypothetical protein [Pseudomonadales bacterium]MBO6824110.1 hypothetical protein [Pseudomonadales bacterium]
MAETNSTVRQKIIALLALLPLLTAFFVGSALDQLAKDAIAKEQQAYGQSTAAQVADHVAEYAVQADVLSLNVISSRLTREASLSFVAVYDQNNRLIAQSGKASKKAVTYAADMTFQDSLVGSVRVAVIHSEYDAAPIIGGFVIAYLVYLTILIWSAPNLESWLFNVARDPVPDIEPDDAPDNIPVLEPDFGPRQSCILVIRIKPARHLEAHFDKFFQAAKLYGGIVEQTTTEELVIHFESYDAMYKATCTGLLIQQIAHRVNSNISFGGTLDLLGDEPDKIRKSASYLASIAEGDLIVAANEPAITDRVELQSFHHALVDSDHLSRIAGLVNQEFLEEQASQLVMQS